jgi:hypothetical protein
MDKRPFNPEALADYASEELRAPLGVGALVWRYTVFVPLEERRPGDAESIALADLDDLENLRALLVQHFLGVTALSPLVGSGLRDPQDQGQVNRMRAVRAVLPSCILTRQRLRLDD